MLEELVRQRLETLLSGHPPASTDVRDFLGAQFDLGLAWVSYPEGRGGLGAPQELQSLIDRTLSDAGAPHPFTVNPIGYGMAAPTLLAFAAPDDLDQKLRPLLTGEEVWCQLFSEPSAGSDVAGLSTRAVRDGDEWVVTGQKVWTSLAHRATWGLLLARTDPTVPKHAGLTYFFIDMHAPGVEVRPLRQATGDAEFNEVFFTELRIPDSSRLGAVGEGWKVAITTLMNERVAIGGRMTPRGQGPIGEAVALWQEAGRPEQLKDRLMGLWVRSEVLRLTNVRARELAKAGGTAGPEGSTAKLLAGELNQDVYEFCVELLGPAGALYPETYEMSGGADGARRDVRYGFLRSQANTIEGGTSEVMRNILGERVLGLPPEPRVDKDVPFNEIGR
ncbi:acyl-CoA dehydrogenase [Aeromicrobium sp. SMF47]|uniref:Acyl-CoA dehydrogenase n=2 Tax=Aeromicrobium yanjiei TaxID=2662028 RepID=A0A5Q2MPB0_9ACTN|nr:acyl-CoA dehydrogenase [Aeromicrobium yanjiei]QGG43236.1 acyl-CoA dehydrogenase [Aeromicrobium yanjiei]